MSKYVETAKLYIKDENYDEAIKLARKRHGKDDIESYISILDLLIDEGQLIALEEKGMYYQYYDPTHDNGDTVKNISMHTLKSNLAPSMPFVIRQCQDSIKGKLMKRLNIWIKLTININLILKLKNHVFLKKN